MSDIDDAANDTEKSECTFPRKARLLTAGDYSQVFKKSQRYSDHYWTILVRHDGELDARLGLAIAKKRAKRAVDRNKLKRVAREAFRHHLQSLSGNELVIMNRDAAGSAEKAVLSRSLNSLLKKIAGGPRKQVNR